MLICHYEWGSCSKIDKQANDGKTDRLLALLIEEKDWWAQLPTTRPFDITAIDLEFNTVVVEVPLAGKSFTVGGPLSPEASLKKGGRTIDLSDFQVRDRVIIKWKAAEKGHIILAITAK